jgi:hypothetical protein
MWTTVFSDDGDMAASEFDEETSGITQQPQQPYQEQRVAFTGSPVYRAELQEVQRIEPKYADEYLIYADRDQQELLEQYGKDEQNAGEIRERREEESMRWDFKGVGF